MAKRWTNFNFKAHAFPIWPSHFRWHSLASDFFINLFHRWYTIPILSAFLSFTDARIAAKARNAVGQWVMKSTAKQAKIEINFIGVLSNAVVICKDHAIFAFVTINFVGNFHWIGSNENKKNENNLMKCLTKSVRWVVREFLLFIFSETIKLIKLRTMIVIDYDVTDSRMIFVNWMARTTQRKCNHFAKAEN